MLGLEHPWLTLGLLVATSLFATVVALTIQRLAGATFCSILIGPIIAICGVLAISRFQARE